MRNAPPLFMGNQRFCPISRYVLQLNPIWVNATSCQYLTKSELPAVIPEREFMYDDIGFADLKALQRLALAQ